MKTFAKISALVVCVLALIYTIICGFGAYYFLKDLALQGGRWGTATTIGYVDETGIHFEGSAVLIFFSVILTELLFIGLLIRSTFQIRLRDKDHAEGNRKGDKR